MECSREKAIVILEQQLQGLNGAVQSTEEALKASLLLNKLTQRHSMSKQVFAIL